MRSPTTERFRKAFAGLPEVVPEVVQDQARATYRKFKLDPWHPGLHFKQVHATLPIYSVRVSRRYRAVGRRYDPGMLWFLIGAHDEYEKLLSRR